VSVVHVLASSGAADLARRASHLRPSDPWPQIRVWQVVGSEVSPAEPQPPAAPAGIPDHHLPWAAVISEAGARPVNDRGVLVAEVAGLEVGRVVDGPTGPTIDVGVGQADRELNLLVHGAGDPGAELRRVVAAVAEYRSPRSHHPLSRLARERWLRSWLLDDPSRIDGAELEPLPPLRPRSGLLAAEPVAAAGRLRSGRSLVVVAMVGIDLDLVPEAADHRASHCAEAGDPDARLVIVVPERDHGPATALAYLVDDIDVIAVEPPWAPGRPGTLASDA
jgi:hypothetical protein